MSSDELDQSALASKPVARDDGTGEPPLSIDIEYAERVNFAMQQNGLAWLAPFTGWSNVLALGLLPFLPGTFLKIALATLLLPVGWKLLSTCNPNPNSTCAK